MKNWNAISNFWMLGMLLALAAPQATADEVILDDLIIDGSACVGTACTETEDFGFDTLRLKADVLRVDFEDTSTSSLFPKTDWRILLNDDDTGSENYFAIEDSTAGTVPLSIAGGSPSNSIYISEGGSVGIGTPQPDESLALDVRGDLRVGGLLTVDGTTFSDGKVKAGIIPKSEFSNGKAKVTFDTPYAGDYTIQLTAVSSEKDVSFSPAVLKREPDGFKISGGKNKLGKLVEIHWTTQLVNDRR